MNKYNQQFNKEIIQELPKGKVTVVAYLDDLSGRKYFLKTEQNKYFWLDSDLDHFEETNESAVLSAIIKHGYKSQANGQTFEFGQRKEVLKNIE